MKYLSPITKDKVAGEIKYTSPVVKSKLVPGPWHREPDFVQFEYHHISVDVYREEGHPIVVTPGPSLVCVLSRSPFGNWNGYVGVGQESPLFGVGYDIMYDLPRGAWVHGGLTYSDRILPFKSTEKRPHKYLRYVHNKKGWAKKKWFFGFDCGHAGDLSPYKSMMKFSTMFDGQYRDQEYVTSEVFALAGWVLKIEAAVAQNHPSYRHLSKS